MIDAVAEYDDAVMENYLEGNEPSEEDLHKCIKIGVNTLQLTPVFMGSALKIKGCKL